MLFGNGFGVDRFGQELVSVPARQILDQAYQWSTSGICVASSRKTFKKFHIVDKTRGWIIRWKHTSEPILPIATPYTHFRLSYIYHLITPSLNLSKNSL